MGDQARRDRGGQAAREEATLARVLLAELLGTWAKTLVAAGGLVVAATSGGQVDAVARAAATGLVVMAISYALGGISGAHINPAISLAFAARGAFPWHKLPLYWAAQLAGALAAAGCLRAAFGPVAHLGASEPHVGAGTALATETTLTFLLATVVLGTATRHRVVGPNAALASGGMVALAALVAGPVSGASMNPARSLGPALVAWHLDNAWLYVVGPLAGACLAALIGRALYGPYRDDEEQAAEGEDGQHAG
ncbi:MAG: aquaporin [Thermomicrobiales bacterium]